MIGQAVNRPRDFFLVMLPQSQIWAINFVRHVIISDRNDRQNRNKKPEFNFECAYAR